MGSIYTTGEFAKKANVSIRTIRFYDKQGILKPSHMSDSGYRLYTDADFAKLQKILTLKYLGFSLDEIMDITVNDDDRDYVRNSLKLQLTLVKKKIESLQVVEKTLVETEKLYSKEKEVDWQKMLQLIHMINMEKSLVEQYKDSSNLHVRSNLHDHFAKNPKRWFSWLYEQMEINDNDCILELGCGNGALWKDAKEKISNCKLILSDISVGMLKDAKENLGQWGVPAECTCFDFHKIPYEDASFDVVVANHVLFYAKDLSVVLSEINRVLKPGGRLYCSTYSENHMKEISQLVKEFDNHIVLSEVNLYDVFGLANGEEILKRFFDEVSMKIHPDELVVTEVSPLLDYIMSCHGNQHEYLNNRYSEFKEFVTKKLEKKGYIKITKQAGLFCARKNGGNL